MSRTYDAVVTPGLEKVAAHELLALGASAVAQDAGMVSFSTTDEALPALMAGLRTVTRVLERVTHGSARRFDELERFAASVSLLRYRSGEATPARVHVSSSKSRLYHTGAIEERLRRWLQLAPPGDTAEPLELWVRLRADRVSLSVDAGGDRLQRRGYRLDGARAPLRETLAAGILMSLGWDGTTPLLDPMCGSGTIAIEGALLATGRSPNAQRRFVCESWPGFKRASRPAERAQPMRFPVVGVDRDPRAISAAEQNGRRAAVDVDWNVASAEDLGPGDLPPGLILANPPYGHRLAHPDMALRSLQGMAARFEGWRIAALWPGPTPPGWRSRLFVRNGGLGVSVIELGGAG